MKEKEKDSNQNHNNDIMGSFSYEEKKLLKKYMEEYNDMYQKILILPKNEFISKLIKHIELFLNSKSNKYAKESRNKIEDFIIEKIYKSDYINARIISENINKRNRYEQSRNYFKGEIIPHCEKDKKNGYYIHTCGERFQTFKYKLSFDYYMMHFSKEKKYKDINTNQYLKVLFCKKCNMIYKSSLIKFRCAETGIYFYSKLTSTNNDNDENDLPFATWAKYHCNVVINDLMKCQKCSNNLYFKKKNKKNYIFCKKCNEMWDPQDVKWECLICKKKFSSDAKVYNPLEFKALKICVREALTEKIKAVPKYLDCKCNIDFSNTIFLHRKSCRGELFIGELNGKKTVICNKCDSIGFYEGYIWTCPICFKKTRNVTKNNKLEDNKSVDKNQSDNKSVINNKVKDKNIDKEINNDINSHKDNISVSKVLNDNDSRRRNYYFSLIKSKINLQDDSLSNSDLKNTTNNDFLKNKIQNILYKGNIHDSIEKRTINSSLKETEINYERTIQNENKDKKGNENNNDSEDDNYYNTEKLIENKISINKEISNILNLNSSRNRKEAYFRSFRKKHITDLSTSLKIMKMDSNSSINKNTISLKKKCTNPGILSDIITRKNSINIQEKTSEKSFSINNSSKTKKIIKPKKSLSINEFSCTNINDLGKILSKLDTKVNIDLKSSVINFRKISSNQIFSKEKNKREENSNSQNMKIIDDSNYEESQVIKNDNFGEKRKRKDSFITKFNRFKKIIEISRKSSSNIIIDGNLKNQSQNTGPNKNIIGISKNLEQSDIIRKVPTNNENLSIFKKSRISQRYKNIPYINNVSNPNDANIDNKSINKSKAKNEKIIFNYKNKYAITKGNEKEMKIDSIYNSETSNDKKRSNSTAEDSDIPSKRVYQGKNPKQSVQIKKAKIINKSNKFYNNNFNINDYKIIKKIGQGSFGQIYLVEDKYQNKFAMKKIIVTSEKDIKKIEKEYQILIDLNLNAQNGKNLNLVKIYGFSSKKLDPTTYVIYVLMELAITDWENEILKRQKIGKYYTEKELMTILSSLINTFADLQKQNISHRDIKPQNILIFRDNKYKLADFGEAKELFKDIAPTNKQTLRGTELYMAPALFYALRSKKVIKYINHNPYKSDVFSFGLCSLFAATLCFESIYDIRELNNNVSIHVILEKYLRKHYSYDVINIISHMLDINETTRKDFIEMQEEFKLYKFN